MHLPRDHSSTESPQRIAILNGEWGKYFSQLPQAALIVFNYELTPVDITKFTLWVYTTNVIRYSKAACVRDYDFLNRA